MAPLGSTATCHTSLGLTLTQADCKREIRVCLAPGGTHIPRAHISRCTQHGMMDNPPRDDSGVLCELPADDHGQTKQVIGKPRVASRLRVHPASPHIIPLLPMPSVLSHAIPSHVDPLGRGKLLISSRGCVCESKGGGAPLALSLSLPTT